MVNRRDLFSILLTGVVLAIVLSGDFSILSVVLASTLVLLSIINILPWISAKQQRYTVTGLTVLVMLAVLLLYTGDPVVVSLTTGAILGLVLLAVKGSEVRWLAIGIFSVAELFSVGFAVQLGRLRTATVLVVIGVFGLLAAKRYWSNP